MGKILKALQAWLFPPKPPSVLTLLQHHIATKRLGSGGISLNPKDFDDLLDQLEDRRRVFMPTADYRGINLDGVAIYPNQKIASGVFHSA